MKNVKYLGLIMIMALMLTGCGSTTNDKTNKEDNKPIAVNPPSKTGYTGVIKIVYLDPTNLNKKCTEENADSEDETKGGCMKWYAYKEDKDTYTMILDHNTKDLVNWVTEADYLEAGGTEEDFGQYGNTDKGPITANKQLKEDTANWDNSLNPRLIQVSEIKEITGCKDSTCYFETGTKDKPSPTPKIAKYAWLFDRTAVNCAEDYGCLNNATTKGNAYWTDTAATEWGSSSTAFHISNYNAGAIGVYSIGWDCWYGIRPVITIQKSNLSFVETNEEQ